MSSIDIDLPCRELVALVTEYLEGTLAADDRARFELHLGSCDGCSTYLRQMRLVLAASGRLSEETLSPGARDARLQAFRGWKAGEGGGE